MRTAVGGLPTEPPEPPGAGRWAAVPAGTGCHEPHPAGGGHLDESARRLSHEEYAVAQMLTAEGHEVRSLAESRVGGRRPDLEACGRGVEVKSFLAAAERGGRPPSPQSVYNKLVDAAGQADSVVLVGHGSGLTEATVRRGMARYASDHRAPPLRSVRAVGDGFDLSWARQPERTMGPTRERQPPRPGPTLEL